MSAKIVIGAGYGDEGKGLTTSFLCSLTENPIVVRFNGGHQAGHTVNHKNKRHVFSGFGSGTLQNIPTYWSSFCTFYPNSFLREYKLLKEYNPVIYVNPLCPVTTPFDIDYNRIQERKNNHGSVGMGFGATIQRQENYYKLFVQDLFHELVLEQKLKSIANYYSKNYLIHDEQIINEDIHKFIQFAKEVTKIIQLADDSIINRYNPIFEGAQGVLLDMDFGFFPNVTRSNTTTKNAISIINGQYPSVLHHTEVYYITRCYLTRHGNGYMPNEIPLTLKNNENETNKSHAYQGEFRIAPLNADLLNYAFDCDNNFSSALKKNLVVTCLDQLYEPHEYGSIIRELLDKLNVKFDKVYYSAGDSFTDIIRL